jgi:simple sugar transport system substrate-binding protein
VLEAVKNGDLLFAVDQQQFLQGYLPVQILALHAQLGVNPVGQVKTGPGFVTKDTAAKAIKLTKEGLR